MKSGKGEKKKTERLEEGKMEKKKKRSGNRFVPC